MLLKIHIIFNNNSSHSSSGATIDWLCPAVNLTLRMKFCYLRIFKLMSKVLTGRLDVIMHRIIYDSQSAFFKERYILDNVLLSQKIIYDCNQKSTSGVIIKIDFKKTYDKIRSYLLEVLTHRGFSHLWIQWITAWLKSSESCNSIICFRLFIAFRL